MSVSRFRDLARRTAPLLIALLALLPVTRGVAAADPITLRIGFTQTATEGGLDPFIATAGTDWLLIADTYDLLTEFGHDLRPAPGLADTWTTSADGLTWTFHIRDGAMWQDGQPITADDVAFTLNFIRESQDPAYKGPQAPDGNDLAGGEEENQPPVPDGEADNQITLFNNYLDLDRGFDQTRVASIEATDPSTLVITTTAPLITIGDMYIPIVPKHVWENVTFKQVVADRYRPENPIGSGPFIIKDFVADQGMRLEANKNYWGGAPKIDVLLYQYFGNDEAAVAALQNADPVNGVDLLLEVPPTFVQKLKDDPRITVEDVASPTFGELGFNSWDPTTKKRFKNEGCSDCPKGPTTGSLGNPWLTKPEVRAALAQLVDKQDLVDRALNGFGQPGKSIVSPYNAFYSYTPPADDPAMYPGSPEAAKARFQAVMTGLGFADTDNDGILNAPDTADAKLLDPNGAGKNFNLRLFVRKDDEEDKIAGSLIETAFDNAGVQVDVSNVSEDPQLYTATYPSSSNADMDMYIWEFGPDPDPDFILSIFTCAQINDWSDANYCDPTYEDLYAQQRTATNLDERAAIVKQMQAQVYSQSPYAVLWYVDTLEAYRSDRWTGFRDFPDVGGDVWDAWGFGPYQSRLTVAPIGAVESTPTPAPPTEAPTATPAAPTPAGSGTAASPAATATPAPVATPAPTASAKPAATPTPSGGGSSGGGGGDSTPVIVIGGGIIVVLLIAFIYLRRKNARDDE